MERFLRERGFDVRVLHGEGNNTGSAGGRRSIFRWIGWPDSHIPFVLKNIKKLKSILREFDPHYIYITSPPFSTLLFLPFIRNRKVLVEFRDVWSYDEILKLYRTPIQKALSRWYEGYSIRKAWKVVCTNENQCECLKRIHRENSGKFITIPHFYIPAETPHQSKGKKERLRICYAGTADWMKGLEKVIPLMKEFEKIEVLIRGQVKDVEIHGAEILPPLDYEETLKWIVEECDAVWISLDRFRGHHLITSSKSKALLSTGKPIFATVPHDNLMFRDFERIGGIYLSDIDDVEGIRRTLSQMVDDWKTGQLMRPENPEIFRYDVVLQELLNAMGGETPPND